MPLPQDHNFDSSFEEGETGYHGRRAPPAHEPTARNTVPND